MLKWRTPLQQQLTSNCLSVTRNGNEIPYDGISMKRSTPGPDQFLLVAAGQTVSSTFDVSEGYDTSKAGTYTIAVNTYIEYAEGSVEGMNEPGKPGIPIKISHLSSPSVSFQVVGRKVGSGTLGQRARSLELENKRTILVGNFQKRSESLNVPLDPVVKGSAAQKELTKEIHRASYHYIKSAISDLQSSPDRVKTWFGSTSVDILLEKFKTMERLLRSDIITYVHGGNRCTFYTYAYTWKGSRTVHLCRLYERSQSLSGFDSKMTTIVHELAHALVRVDDIGYGVSYCKDLAKSAPHLAANNADNYCYFAATLFPFNYGVDVVSTLSNGHIYVFKGNLYVQYTDCCADNPDGYPKLIKDRFGNLPENFKSGFDAMEILPNGKLYVIKGSEYIRYSNPDSSQFDAGYPAPIKGNWGNVPQ